MAKKAGKRRRYDAAEFASADPLIAHFAEYYTIRAKSRRTIVAYQRDLEHFGSFLAAKTGQDRAAHRDPPYTELLTAKASDILGYIKWLQSSRRYAPTSIRRKVSCLRSFYKLLRYEDRRPDNPTFGVPVPDLPRRKLPGVLEVKHVRSALTMEPPGGLTAEQRARDRAILECLYSSGLRRSELIGLNEADVNLDLRTLRVVGKGNKMRVVPMTRQAADALRRYLDLRGPSPTGAFFTGRGGARISESMVYKIVRLYLRLAGVADENAHPHILRHSVATHMHERGADMLFLKEFLGHASTATTEIYTHMSAELLRKEFDETHARESMDEGAPPSRRRAAKRSTDTT